MKNIFLIILLSFMFLSSCTERKCDKIDNKFRPHLVVHCNKSKIYQYYHNNPCDCNGINDDLCLDCFYQKTYRDYVEYYDNKQRVYGK